MRALNHGSRPTAGASPAPPLLITPAAAAGMTGEVQLQPAAAAAGAAGAGASDAGRFDSDMVIVLAALLCVLVCALGLNALVHHCLVLDFGRATLTAAVAAAPAAATAAAGAGAGSASATDENTGGLKKRELRRIPVVVYEGWSAATQDCAICLGEFDDGEKVRVLPGCQHGFHVQCIDPWLAKHPSCPTCRNSLVQHQQGRRRHAGDGDGEAASVAGDET